MSWEREFYIRKLVPLIKKNYENRRRTALTGDGKFPDKWYWADERGCEMGFCYDPQEDIVKEFK